MAQARWALQHESIVHLDDLMLRRTRLGLLLPDGGASVLELIRPMAMELCTEGESKNLLDTLVAVEEACQREFADKGKEIWANVEFYKGAVFHSLGIPTENFTSLFAMARVYGYVAHFLEFRKDSRLIRPRAAYTGPRPGERDKTAA